MNSLKLYNICPLGKPQKKSSTNGQAIKRGVKAGPLRKKELFLKLFFIYFVAI